MPASTSPAPVPRIGPSPVRRLSLHPLHRLWRQLPAGHRRRLVPQCHRPARAASRPPAPARPPWHRRRWGTVARLRPGPGGAADPPGDGGDGDRDLAAGCRGPAAWRHRRPGAAGQPAGRGAAAGACQCADLAAGRCFGCREACSRAAASSAIGRGSCRWCRASWRAALPFVHEIWVLSRFTGDAVARLLPPGRISCCGWCRSRWPSRRRGRPGATGPASGCPDDALIVLVVFNLASSFVRKNPLAAIAAFRQAFGDRADRLLLLKIGHTGTLSRRPDFATGDHRRSQQHSHHDRRH